MISIMGTELQHSSALERKKAESLNCVVIERSHLGKLVQKLNFMEKRKLIELILIDKPILKNEYTNT